MTGRQPGEAVFRPGDVVRTKEGGLLGVVLSVHCMDDGQTYQWLVDVDMPGGEVRTLGPHQLLKTNDPISVAEAQELGLRFPSPRRAGEFRPGDVVRSRDGASIGTVLHVEYFNAPPVELHVDEPDKGVGTWPADQAVLSNDAASVAEAKRLGLDFGLLGPNYPPSDEPPSQGG
jgi:hypothetical protein